VRVEKPFEYVAWFRDADVETDDPDYEWPAVFIVKAATATLAQEWGDSLSRSRASRAREVFLRSATRPLSDPAAGEEIATAEAMKAYAAGDIAIVVVGDHASDEIIGW
jgi:hypothetical protein